MARRQVWLWRDYSPKWTEGGRAVITKWWPNGHPGSGHAVCLAQGLLKVKGKWISSCNVRVSTSIRAGRGRSTREGKPSDRSQQWLATKFIILIDSKQILLMEISAPRSLAIGVIFRIHNNWLYCTFFVHIWIKLQWLHGDPCLTGARTVGMVMLHEWRCHSDDVIHPASPLTSTSLSPRKLTAICCELVAQQCSEEGGLVAAKKWGWMGVIEIKVLA